VLDLHPFLCPLSIQFHGLLLDSENLLLIALHHKAIPGTILRFTELNGTKGQQVADGPKHLHAWFKDLYGAIWCFDVHYPYYNKG
jgi:hypothetical protein